jgi:hypothetical protein
MLRSVHLQRRRPAVANRAHASEITLRFEFSISLWLLMTVLCVSIGSRPALADKADWKPIDPGEISLKASAIEKDADAEAIFWDIQVEDHASEAVLSHYIRIKIFNERGRGSQSQIDLSFTGKNKIEDIAGRTIKADGNVIELSSNAVFERTLIRAKGLKVQARSFALPGVEPGAIIEYRWRERRHHFPYFLRLQLQRDIPVQHVYYHLKTDPDLKFAMRTQTFNAPQIPWESEKKGFMRATVTNMPAFHEEPQMPPEAQVRPWLLVYYSNWFGAEGVWSDHSKTIYEAYRSEMKANAEVRKVASEAVAEASTSEQKLKQLFEYCRSKIKNVNYESSGLTPEERTRFKENKCPSDTLKSGMGTGMDIDLLFAALANAAGFESRVALPGDRGDIFFDHRIHLPHFLEAYNVAVRVDNQWRFFDPASLYVPFGMLRWQEEGQEAMISDPTQPIFVMTPLSPAEKSLKKRTATFHLSEDGTLDGGVYVEHTGHCAVDSKRLYDDASEAQREEALRDRVKEHLTTAELSNIHLEGVTDPGKSFSYSHHIRVPGYAARTGKRLFLQPAFFQHGWGPLFPNSQRKHDVYFHYPWREEDDVTIELPAGFTLDNADSPGGLAVGKDCTYDVKITITKDGRTLRYKRSFMFGGNGGILIPAANYAQLKVVFDAVYENDTHTITLKQGPMMSSLADQK